MTRRPNFLIIVADDLGFSDVGTFGSEIKTPNIDSLADQGLRFTSFYTASACSPTRSMLLSGTDHHIAGVGTMIESIKDFQRGRPGYEGYLSDRVAALPEVLRDSGYHTLMSGKWHLGLTPDRWPCRRGFTRSYTLLPGAANHYGWEPQLDTGDDLPDHARRTPVFYAENDKSIHNKDLQPNFYSTDRFTDKLLQYLDERTATEKEKPFFAYLAYSAPHWPLQAPDADIQDYKGRYDEGPEVLRQERLRKLKGLGLVPEHAIPHEVIAPAESRGSLLSKQWQNLNQSEKAFSARTMEAYAGMVQRMDTGIGRVLNRLRETDELDNTFVVFMSDNGAEGHWLECVPVVQGDVFDHIARYYDNSIENIGRQNSYVWYGPHWASAATAPARLYKGFISEGGIRVPFLVRYPPLTSNALKSDRGISHAFSTVMDLMPTMLELAGISAPQGTYKGRNIVPMRGKSWLSYLKQLQNGQKSGPGSIHDPDTAMSWELFGRMAVRKGEWKALYIDEPWGPDTWQLYNVRDDPGETQDLAKKHPAILADLLKQYLKYREDVGIAGEAPQYGVLNLTSS